MDKEPTSAPAAMDTRSNKEIPVWRECVDMDEDKSASTAVTKPRTNKPINPQVHKQQTPEHGSEKI